MDNDEGIEHIRQIRLSRRNAATTSTSKSTTSKKKKVTVENVTSLQASELLKLIEEGQL